MYKLTVMLVGNSPLPQIGDRFEVVMIEDGNFNKFDVPYIIATLEPIKEDPYRESDKEIIGV